MLKNSVAKDLLKYVMDLLSVLIVRSVKKFSSFAGLASLFAD